MKVTVNCYLPVGRRGEAGLGKYIRTFTNMAVLPRKGETMHFDDRSWNVDTVAHMPPTVEEQGVNSPEDASNWVYVLYVSS